jgi:deoxycytidine triphosphate deaminase
MNKENWPRLEANVNWQSGFLIDEEIKRAMANNQLVRNGDAQRARYASYELRIGPNVQQLVMDDNGQPNRDIYRAKHIPEDETFVIQPGETFKIYAVESIMMPANVLAFAIPVGIMYKLGLNPETTFADPGFEGDFYITICNYSPRVVRLKVGDPLARVFFFKLRERPDIIHESRPREMPPAVERVPRPSAEELEAVGELAVLTNVLGCVDPPHYQHAFVTNRVISVQRRQMEDELAQLRRQLRVVRWVVLGLGVAVVCMLVVFGYRAAAGRWPTLTEGTIASLLATAIWLGGGKVLKIAAKWQ